MYKWYHNVQICYVYLVDVPSSNFDHSSEAIDGAFSRSRWFRRGWTLQELIAPRNMKFFAKDWTVLGTKVSRTSSAPIVSKEPSPDDPFICKLSKITGIGKRVLEDPSGLRYTSVLQRMSWAARRQTTREKDIAYALMGLFGVHIPILYSEGQQMAFRRLQLEIIKTLQDHTIFAWKAEKESSRLLADSLCNFPYSGKFKPYNSCRTTYSARVYSITNIGLSINLRITQVYDAEGADLILAVLRCWFGSKDDLQRIWIYLKPVLRTSTTGSVLPIYRRVRCHEFDHINHG
jgi:hypothetical protein